MSRHGLPRGAVGYLRCCPLVVACVYSQRGLVPGQTEADLAVAHGRIRLGLSCPPFLQDPAIGLFSEGPCLWGWRCPGAFGLPCRGRGCGLSPQGALGKGTEPHPVQCFQFGSCPSRSPAVLLPTPSGARSLCRWQFPPPLGMLFQSPSCTGRFAPLRLSSSDLWRNY